MDRALCQANGERRTIGSFNHGSMANAMLHAIHALAAFPKRQVISFSGDGGFTMMMGEFVTLIQTGLPIKIPYHLSIFYDRPRRVAVHVGNDRICILGIRFTGGYSSFWARIFGVTFGLGVVPGIVMPFEFGRIGAGYPKRRDPYKVRPVRASPPLLWKASFFGMLIVGRGRVSPRTIIVGSHGRDGHDVQRVLDHGQQ